MTGLRHRHGGETGAMIIQMALASIAMLALVGVAVDYGVKLIARTEAQRAADAGALAGAVALAFDDPTDLTDSGVAKRSARGYAVANTVFGEAPDVNITNDVKFIECPPPNGGPGTLCVQVDVYRNQQRNNALPALFTRMVGVTSQGVKATATAKVLNGDTTDCLRPWAVIDRWDENNNAVEPVGADFPDPDFCPGGANCAGQAPSTYDKYSDGKGQAPPAEPDLYIPPAADGSDPGTGYRVPDDIGKRFALKIQAGDGITSGWGLALDLPRTDSGNLGANAYGDNILTCSGIDITINDPAVPCPTDANALGTWAEKVEWGGKGCVRVQTGTMQGPTSQNVTDLVAQDSAAKWGTTPEGTPGVVDSCCSASPRIVPVAIADIDQYLAQNPTGSGGVVRIVNIFGFFIEGMGDFDDKTGEMEIKKGGKAVIGRLMKFAGSGSGKVTLHNSASYTKIIVLVR